MKVTLKSEPVFTLLAGRREFKNMRKVGEWEGLMKLQGESTSTVAILSDSLGPFQRAFADLLGPQLDQYYVIMATPDIIAAIKGTDAESVAEK